MLYRLSFLYLTILLGLAQCASNEGDKRDRTTIIESDHFFSDPLRKDHFVQEFLGGDVLLGMTRLRIISADGDTLMDNSSYVSNYFWKVENHYLDEDAKVDRFWYLFDRSFNDKKFVPIADLFLTGLNYSSEEQNFQDMINDSSSIGYSFQQDYWISFSKKYKKIVVFRAVKKDVLKKYGIE